VNLRQLVPDRGAGSRWPGANRYARCGVPAPGRRSRGIARAAPSEVQPVQGEAPLIQPIPRRGAADSADSRRRAAPRHPDALEELDRQHAPAPLSAPVIEPQLAPLIELPPRQVPLLPAAPIPRIAPQRIEREVAPPVVLPPREVPLVPAAPIQRIAPQRIEREVAPPVALPPREVPQVPAAPIERIAPPAIEREAAPPVVLPPREVPLAPSAPIERITPPAIEREVAPPVLLPPREVPVIPAAPIEQIAPRRLEPAPGSVPGESAPRIERPTAPAAAPSAAPAKQPATRTEPSAAEPLPRLRLGAPQADEDIFKPRRDVITPPTEPGGAPHIDREALRQQAREIAARGLESRGVFTLPITPPPERESKEAKAIDKATKSDCRTAYSGLAFSPCRCVVARRDLRDGG
jgi:DNA segregation ATPase FtsK/SpoIIIE-like protein